MGLATVYTNDFNLAVTLIYYGIEMVDIDWPYHQHSANFVFNVDDPKLEKEVKDLHLKFKQQRLLVEPGRFGECAGSLGKKLKEIRNKKYAN